MRFNIPALLTSLAAGLLINQAGAAPIQDIQNTDLRNSSSSLPLYNFDLPYDKALQDGLVKRKPPSNNDQLSWSDAILTGKRNIAKLENPGTSTNYANYKTHYHEGGGRHATKELQFGSDNGYWPPAVLDLLGLTKEDKYQSVSIFSNDQIKKHNLQRPVAQNGYIPSHGLILAKSNFKNQDHNEVKNQLPPAEIMLQVWDELAGNKKDDLHWIVRSNIVNEGTKSIIDEAYQRLGKSDKQMVKVTQAEHLEVFQALSGTPNCKGIYPTFANHGNTQGKEVTALWIYKEPGQYFIAMEMENSSC
ncbi:uncharacterized protein ACHE_21267S [Aspergillus chevalieri]|uniref:Uncharacterized protein n=1 Tax=Aspergillus chevalieri TaxID=182096 RepID=A0A7R7VL06_ASPCH|nr:uncharacterized protein ACHE_21267S [Aspergillus chevalieri]BCR85809.1 hypothetical protein ACHE_21267S [Aspergillus chevalieri]